MGGGVKHVDVPSDSRDLWGGGSNMLMCRVIAEIYGGGSNMLMCRVIAEIYGGGSNMLMCRVIAEIYSRGGGVKHVDVPSDSRDLWGGGQTC